MWGSLVDPEKQDWDWVQGMRSFARVAQPSHERLTSTVIPVSGRAGDGGGKVKTLRQWQQDRI